MSKRIGSKHVSLGGVVGTHQWSFLYLTEEHFEYAIPLIYVADALQLGRRTYEGLSMGQRHIPRDPLRSGVC